LNNEFSKERDGTGTNEWAEIKYNIQRGCLHGCLYCYARESALRYKRIETREEWETEIINLDAVNKKWTKKDGVIMFPTTHDITPTNIEHCVKVLKNMLTPGNKVLIVSKPHLSCIQRLCEELKPWQEQILFRFTIGSLDEETCSFWEPGAPTPKERLSALTFAYVSGYQTSVSMEPMLGGYMEAIRVYSTVESFTTESIWIGKMNKIRTRVDMSIVPNVSEVKRIECLQSDNSILELVDRLKNEPKVRWKDSIKKVIKEVRP